MYVGLSDIENCILRLLPKGDLDYSNIATTPILSIK